MRRRPPRGRLPGPSHSPAPVTCHDVLIGTGKFVVGCEAFTGSAGSASSHPHGIRRAEPARGNGVASTLNMFVERRLALFPEESAHFCTQRAHPILDFSGLGELLRCQQPAHLKGDL